MDFTAIINTVKENVPVPVIIAVVAVIMLVYGSMYLASVIEEAVETKTGKQIRIFDHKKIWLSVFWCAIVSVALALAGYIAWRETAFYGLFILGSSTLCYEAFLKKIGINKEETN